MVTERRRKIHKGKRVLMMLSHPHLKPRKRVTLIERTDSTPSARKRLHPIVTHIAHTSSWEAALTDSDPSLEELCRTIFCGWRSQTVCHFFFLALKRHWACRKKFENSHYRVPTCKQLSFELVPPWGYHP